VPKSKDEVFSHLKKRVEANDPPSMRVMGTQCYGVRDYGVAFDYYTKAASLGDVESHFLLSDMYRNGYGVEKNEKEELYHMEKAAIGGHPVARYNLGCYEGRTGRIDRMMKHFIIAAKLGYDSALEQVKKGFQRGEVSKEDYASSLRGHQAAVDATKSEQREEAYAALKIRSSVQFLDT
jgi:hypothetical protein